MNEGNNRQRALFIFTLFCFTYFAIAINLYILQIKQHSFFKNLANKQYNITVQSYPARGIIYDRHERPIAVNNESIALFITPKSLNEEEKTVQFLKKHFPSAYERYPDNKNKNFMFVKRNITAEEFQLVCQANISDLYTLKESTRFYPYQALGELIGITDIDNKGQFGIEAQFEKSLQGSATIYNLKKDAKSHHFYFSKELNKEGTDPVDIHLTIDAVLQHKCSIILQKALIHYGSSLAGAIILDPNNGDILAAVSAPTFNPNDTQQLNIEHTKCRPFTDSFEFGSVFKAFAATAALQEGATNLEEMIDCENKKETYIDHLRVRTVYPNGVIPFKEVIQSSNNIGIVKVMKRINQDLYDYYTMFGFGSLTGIHVAGEHKGFINHPKNWSAYSIQSLSYGYEITATLLQLARAFSLFFNGGYLVTPKLIESKVVQSSGPFLSQKTIDDMMMILQAVIKEGSGKLADIPGYEVYGKTGTAHILENGEYNENKHLYTFMGAIKKDTYSRVICCFVKESKRRTYSSMITAPLFKELAEACIMTELKS